MLSTCMVIYGEHTYITARGNAVQPGIASVRHSWIAQEDMITVEWYSGNMFLGSLV